MLKRMAGLAVILACLQPVGVYAIPIFEQTGNERLSARGMSTGGTPSADNDGVTFAAESGEGGEGVAANRGATGAFSLAASAGAVSSARTDWEAEFLLGGSGTVEVDLGFTLFADAFDNPQGFASAGFQVTGDFGFVEELLQLSSVTGLGEALEEMFVITLTTDVDLMDGLPPQPAFLGVSTFADASAATGGSGAGAVFDGIVDVRLIEGGMGGDGGGMGGGDGGVDGGEPVSVPESTTGAVLLVGLAGLTLLRRRPTRTER